MLRGIVRGVWILEYNWIVKSFEANEWLPELSYEMNSFSNAVEVIRYTFTYFVVKFLIFLDEFCIFALFQLTKLSS